MHTCHFLRVQLWIKCVLVGKNQLYCFLIVSNLSSHLGNDKKVINKRPDPFGPSPSCCPALTLELYLLGVGGGLQTVVLGVHHGHVGAAVVQHLLHAVHAAALAACADGGAGDGVVAAQAVHLAAGRLTVLHAINSQSEIKLRTQETQSPFPNAFCK